MTDTMGRMHSDAQFAGSSSVPAHVEMMGFLGIGNNPMVGCTVACAVDVATALNNSSKLSFEKNNARLPAEHFLFRAIYTHLVQFFHKNALDTSKFKGI